jgi:hypothetical protein
VSRRPKQYFKLKNVLFLSPHYLWEKDSFVRWLDSEEEITVDKQENSPEGLLLKKNKHSKLLKEPEVDVRTAYAKEFFED